ncbi:hypothetical protein FRC08_016401, partial [Ceratobasidium sp. 394]
MSREHNQASLAGLRDGTVFGIVCTDVAGMGIDIPDVELVIQYQLPVSLSVLWQCLGRAARNALLRAIAIVLVEKKHFSDEKARIQQKAETRRVNARKRKHEALLKEDADAQVESRLNTLAQTPTQQSTAIRPINPLPFRSRRGRRSKSEAIEKGLDQFINSHLSSEVDKRCRHGAINQYFGNQTEGAASGILSGLVDADGSIMYQLSRTMRAASVV